MGREAHTHSGDRVYRGIMLRKRRKELHLTQQELANLLKCDKSVIYKWEKGKKDPLSDENIARYHEILGVDKDYFDAPQPVEKPFLGIKEKNSEDYRGVIVPPKRPPRRDAHASQDTPPPSYIFTEQYLRDTVLYQHDMEVYERYFDLGNLESRSSEHLIEITKKYANSFKDIASCTSIKSQILIYTITVKTPPSMLTLIEDMQMMVTEEDMSVQPAPIILGLTGTCLSESKYDYWIEEFDHLKRQLDEYIDDIIKSNTTTTLCVFALAPQPLVTKLGYLLRTIPNVNIFQPNSGTASWNWKKSYEKIEYMSYEPKTMKDIVVLNLSLSTLIKKSMIEHVLGSGLSIWTFTMEEPSNDFLKSKNQLDDFKVCFRDMLNKIISIHSNNVAIHLFLSTPIAIAFEIGRLWNPDSDPELNLYGLSRESGEYSLIHTISKS